METLGTIMTLLGVLAVPIGVGIWIFRAIRKRSRYWIGWGSALGGVALVIVGGSLGISKSPGEALSMMLGLMGAFAVPIGIGVWIYSAATKMGKNRIGWGTALAGLVVLVVAVSASPEAPSEEPPTAGPAIAEPGSEGTRGTATPEEAEAIEPTLEVAAGETVEPIATDTPRPTQSPEESEPVELVFNVSIQAQDGKPRVEVETNLPDGMELGFTVKDASGTLGQDEARVDSGVASAGPFSRQGQPYEPGEYILNVSSPLLMIQPDGVQDQLGESGENYYGKHILEGRVDFETAFVVPGDQEETDRAREEELNSLEEHLAYLEDKVEALEQAKGREESDWAAWSREFNVDLLEHQDGFREEFGANVNEFTGYCRLGFFDIAVAFSDLYSLWFDYDDYVTGDGNEAYLNRRTEDLRVLLDEAQAEIDACREG